MKRVLWIGGVVLLGVLLLTTRFGVFLVFDVLGDLRGTDNLPLDSATGPFSLSGELVPTPAPLTLPDAVEQASGIAVDADHLYLVTDQAEIFALGHDGVIRWRTVLSRMPLLLRQGSTEAITRHGTGLLTSGEMGEMRHLSLDPARTVSSQALPRLLRDTEFTAMTEHQGRLLGLSENARLFDLRDGREIALDLSTVSKPGHNAQNALFSGMASAGDALYLVSEAHATLVMLDGYSYRAMAAYGLAPAEYSGLAYDQGRLYLTVDHNLFDPRPPLYTYLAPVVEAEVD